MKAQTKLNIIVYSSIVIGPMVIFGGLMVLIYLLRSVLQMASGPVIDEWFLSGMIAAPFSLMLIIPLWIVCGIIILHIEVDDHEGPRKIPTKWDEPNPEVEEIIKRVEKRMKASKAAEAKEENTS